MKVSRTRDGLCNVCLTDCLSWGGADGLGEASVGNLSLLSCCLYLSALLSEDDCLPVGLYTRTCCLFSS